MNISGVGFTQSVIYKQPTMSNQSHSEEELRKMVDNVFAQFDKNKTDELDSRELKQFLQYAVKLGLLQQSKKSLFIEYIFKMDTNGDGLVSKQQLIQFFRKKANGTLPKQSPHPQKLDPKAYSPGPPAVTVNFSETELRQHVEMAFQKYDANKTGEMDYYQLRNYLKQEWNNGFHYHQIIKGSDLNGNGLLSRDELYQFLSKRNIGK